MSPEKVPFLDLALPHRALEKELTEVFTAALRTGRFVGGPMVEEFEKEFARFCGTDHAISVNSGTDAIRFALIAAGVKVNDVVLTVPNTFIATTEAISQAGACPMFVDIEEETYSMDPKALLAFLEQRCDQDASRTRTVLKQTGQPVSAVVPVHLYGQMADMDSILEIAGRYNLLVIEDACQAHGAAYHSAKSGRWVKAGVLGKAGGFSFYPGKNLGCLGEGGAVTTSDAALARTVRMLRDHGQVQKYYHDFEGYNGRLDAIQAGMLSVKLKYLADWNEIRRKRARAYNTMLQGLEDVSTPYEPKWARSIYHLYVIRTSQRERLQQFLTAKGIGTGLHYPVPLHLQKAYAARKYHEGDFPVSEMVAREILSLPMFPELTGEQQEEVVKAIAEFVKTASSSAGGLRS